jgi:hypothetical protein
MQHTDQRTLVQAGTNRDRTATTGAGGRLAEIGEACMPESQRRSSGRDVIPMRWPYARQMRDKHVVDKLSPGLAEAEGKCTGTRKLSGN